MANSCSLGEDVLLFLVKCVLWRWSPVKKTFSACKEGASKISWIQTFLPWRELRGILHAWCGLLLHTIFFPFWTHFCYTTRGDYLLPKAPTRGLMLPLPAVHTVQTRSCRPAWCAPPAIPQSFWSLQPPAEMWSLFSRFLLGHGPWGACLQLLWFLSFFFTPGVFLGGSWLSLWAGWCPHQAAGAGTNWALGDTGSFL